MPRPFDAIVTDLDGTIVGSSGVVSTVTIAAVKALRRAHIPVLAATARTPAGLHILGPALGEFTTAVCSNGALGVEPSTGHVLWRIGFPPATVERIVSAIVAHLPEAGFGAYDGHCWAITATYPAVRGRAPSGPAVIATARTIAQTEAVAMAVCHPALHSAQIADLMRTAGIGQHVAELTYGATHLLDIAPPKVSKASGVIRMLAELGIEPARVVAFGDGHNDLSMFAAVGTSIAVANADPAVRTAATWITGHVDDDGFAWALNHLKAMPTAPAAPDSANRSPTNRPSSPSDRY